MNLSWYLNLTHKIYNSLLLGIWRLHIISFDILCFHHQNHREYLMVANGCTRKRMDSYKYLLDGIVMIVNLEKYTPNMMTSIRESFLISIFSNEPISNDEKSALLVDRIPFELWMKIIFISTILEIKQKFILNMSDDNTPSLRDICEYFQKNWCNYEQKSSQNNEEVSKITKGKKVGTYKK